MSQPYPNCQDCRHFYVTWDPSFPRGCRAYQIKSRDFPAVVVSRSSGQSCQLHSAKPSPSSTPSSQSSHDNTTSSDNDVPHRDPSHFRTEA